MYHKTNCTLTEFQKKESMGMPCGGIWRMWGDILIDFLSDTKHGNWHLNSHIKKKPNVDLNAIVCVGSDTIGQRLFVFLITVLHKEVMDLIHFMCII